MDTYRPHAITAIQIKLACRQLIQRIYPFVQTMFVFQIQNTLDTELIILRITYTNSS